MNKKLALIAASVIAINAHANAQEMETQPVEEDQGALETLFSDDQPPLEGDSPLVDEDAAIAADDEVQTDDALVGEGYAEQDVEALTTTPVAAPDPLVAEGDPAMQDAEPMDAETAPVLADPVMTDEELISDEPVQDFAETDEDAVDPMAAETDAEPMMAEGEAEAETEADTALADAEPLPARDAKIAAVPTDPTEAAAEATLIAGTYEVTIPNRPGTSTLFIEGRGTEAGGTFDGEPIDVIVTGRNFSFDAPVTMNGEEQLMTFAGTAEDGMIDNGVIEAQGDGGYLTFDARRVDAGTMDEAADASFETGLEDDAAAMDGMDAMEEDSASDALTTDGSLEGDMGIDDSADMEMDAESDADASMNADVPADFSTGAEDREDAAAAAAGFETETEMEMDAGDVDMEMDDSTSMEMDAESDADASMNAEVPADFSTGAEDREDAAAAAAGFEDEADTTVPSEMSDETIGEDADADEADPNFDY